MPLDDTKLHEPDLRSRAAAKQAVAWAMKDDKLYCRESWVAAGFAVEFSLKALITRRRGWIAWPSRQAQPELHIHSLKQLFNEAEIVLSAMPPPLKPSVRMVLDWERRHDYMAGTMPRKVAKSMVEAAFGINGVVPWLNQLT